MKIDGEANDKQGYKKRKWKIDLDDDIIRKIQSYRGEYEKHLKLHNNTSNKATKFKS